MDKLLADKHIAVRRNVRTFCERELRPIAAAVDQEARFPWEIVEKMATDAGITKAAAQTALGSFIDSVTKALKKKDGKVTLVGFGTFQKTRRRARKGRNPQTGESIKIKAGNSVKFKAGTKLKAAI